MGLPFSANSRVSETSLVLSPVPFDNPYIFPFNSQNLLVSAFFTCLAVLEESGALLRPKNGYLVWSRGVSSARARRQAQNIAAA